MCALSEKKITDNCEWPARLEDCHYYTVLMGQILYVPLVPTQ